MKGTDCDTVKSTAQYEADQARQRYMRMDAANRLVADSLDVEWNDKRRPLAAVREGQSALQVRVEDPPRVVSDPDGFDRYLITVVAPLVSASRRIRASPDLRRAGRWQSGDYTERRRPGEVTSRRNDRMVEAA